MMSDETKQKVLLGSLLSVVLGAGGWYIVFGGAGSREQPLVTKERIQGDRYTGADTGKMQAKPDRHPRTSEQRQPRVKIERIYRPDAPRKPQLRRGGNAKRRISKRFTTPVAFVQAVDPVRNA